MKDGKEMLEEFFTSFFTGVVKPYVIQIQFNTLNTVASMLEKMETMGANDRADFLKQFKKELKKLQNEALKKDIFKNDEEK